jgi:hypothetical protein
MDVTWTNVRRLLSDCILNHNTGDSHSGPIWETLTAIAEPSSLAKLIQSVASDSRTAKSCAAESFRHPLGFDKVVLLNCSPLFTLRAHVWWPTATIGVEHIHNHRFSFFSYVLRGGYTMETFEPADESGMQVTEYEERLAENGSWQLRPLGLTYLRPIAAQVVEQGNGYELAAKDLHRVTVRPGAMCMTLFLQATPTCRETRVFASPQEEAPNRTEKDPFSVQLYRDKLDSIISEIAGRSTAYASRA